MNFDVNSSILILKEMLVWSQMSHPLTHMLKVDLFCCLAFYSNHGRECSYHIICQ